MHRIVLPLLLPLYLSFIRGAGIVAKGFEQMRGISFFIKSKGLYNYFERNGGKLDTAVVNAIRSMEDKLASGREYTFSELGKLIKKLQEL